MTTSVKCVDPAKSFAGFISEGGITGISGHKALMADVMDFASTVPIVSANAAPPKVGQQPQV